MRIDQTRVSTIERNLIRERTQAGLEAARARGGKGGKWLKLDDKKHALAVELYRKKEYRVDEICGAVGISKPTLDACVRGADAAG